MKKNKQRSGSRILAVIGLLFCMFFVSLSALQAQEAAPDSTEVDSTAKRKLSFSGYPYAYYTPETELAFGVGGIAIFYTAANRKILPSKTTIGGWYSTNNQYNISIKPVMYFNRNKVYLELPVNFGHYVDKFWGIGNNTVDTGTEKYTLNEFAATFKFQIPPLWFASDRTGIIVDYNYTEIEDKKDNSYLNNNEVSGSDGGTLIGLGTDFVWDTRDHLFFPNSGTYQLMEFVVYPNWGDFLFYTLELDLRHYSAFSPDHVFASNIYFAAANGDVPFYKLPQLGGQNRMRGYFEGRYRDNVFWAIQLEYRQYFWWKLGFVPFLGVGDVADNLLSISLSNLKYSYGIGLRYLFNEAEKVNLRVDFGFGNDGNSGVYFGIEEAF